LKNDEKQALINRLRELQDKIFERDEFEFYKDYLSIIRKLLKFDQESAIEGAVQALTPIIFHNCDELFHGVCDFLISNKEIANKYAEKISGIADWSFEGEYADEAFFIGILSLLKYISPEEAEKVAVRYSDFESWDRDERDMGEYIRVSCFETLLNLGVFDVDDLAYTIQRENSHVIRTKAIEAISKIKEKKELPHLYVLATGYVRRYYQAGRDIGEFEYVFKHYPEVEKAVKKAFKNMGEKIDKVTAVFAAIAYYCERQLAGEFDNYYRFVHTLSEKYKIDLNKVIAMFESKLLTEQEMNKRRRIRKCIDELKTKKN